MVLGPKSDRHIMKSRVTNKAAYRKHEYLRDTGEWKYQSCKSCMARTLFACLICGFCWSCHWKVEQLAKIPDHLLGVAQSQ